MKAIVLEAPGSLKKSQVDEAAKPRSGEALVAVRRVGVCGTDFSGWRGTMPLMSYPRILGHELSVEVLEAPGADGVVPGDRCSVEPYMNCGACYACRRGRGNCCEDLKVLGVHIDGGMRERMILPSRKLHPSSTLTPEQLALVEPLAIGFHAVQRGAPARGDDVLIVGAGPIGLAAIEFAGVAGARLTVTDVNPARLQFAGTRRGVLRTAAADALAKGPLFGLVIDATGNAQSMRQSIDFVANSGTLVYVGITPDEIRVPDPLLHRKELSLLGSRNALGRDFDRIITLMEQGQVDTRPWVTHRTPFDGLVEAFPNLAKPEAGVLKAMIEVS